MKIAVVPARGGSKRIPKKNIRLFLGKPIIGYSIEVALKSGLFDRVIVSTDDEDIAAVAKRFGAEVPFLRPKELADDFTGTNAVAKHAIQWVIQQEQPVDYACCIYATAPFVRAHYLRQGFEKLVRTGKSFAFTVTTFPSAVQRALRITSSGEIEAMFPENIDRRTQDLEPGYHDAGQFCWGTARAFLDDEVVFSRVSIPVILPRITVQDIDTLDDWENAEALYRFLYLRENSNG